MANKKQTMKEEKSPPKLFDHFKLYRPTFVYHQNILCYEKHFFVSKDNFWNFCIYRTMHLYTTVSTRHN